MKNFNSSYPEKLNCIVLRCGVLMCPLAFIGAFVLKLPVQLVVLMVMAEEIVKIICAITRLKSSKWIKNVIKEV